MTTITVQEVRPQQPGKKTCVVVDVNGDYYYVWPNHATMYEAGRVYDVAYSTRSFQGKQFRYVDNPPIASMQAPQRAQPKQVEQPRPQNGQGYNTYRETSKADKESMFVTAMMKGIAQAQMVDINNEAELIELGRRLRRVFYAVWASPQQQTAQRQQPQQPNDMNDQIPF